MRGGEHIADTDNRERRGSATDEADGIGDETWEIDTDEKDKRAGNNGENVWISNGT